MHRIGAIAKQLHSPLLQSCRRQTSAHLLRANNGINRFWNPSQQRTSFNVPVDKTAARKPSYIVPLSVDMTQDTTSNTSYGLFTTVFLFIPSVAVAGCSVARKELNKTYHEWVSIWHRDGQIIYLLGTEHGASLSVDLAVKLVKDVSPKAVFIELDLFRLRLLFETDYLKMPTPNLWWQEPAKMRAADSITWLYPKKGYSGVSLWAWMQRKNGPTEFTETTIRFDADEYGNNVKEYLNRCEFIEAARVAQRVEAAVVLGDQVTIKHLILLLLEPQIRERTTEWHPSYSRRMVQQWVAEVSSVFYHYVIAERDNYMAVGLDHLPQFETIVAVVGKGDVDGVEQRLQTFGWKPVNGRFLKAMMRFQTFVQMWRTWNMASSLESSYDGKALAEKPLHSTTASRF